MQNDVSEEFVVRELIFKVRDWLKYFKTKWLLITLITLLGSGIGLIYGFNQKPVYVANLSFALEDEKSSGMLGGALGLASQFGFDMGSNASGAFSGANLVELIQSRNIVEKALLEPVKINRKEVSLADYYIDFTDMRKKWQRSNYLNNLRFLPGSKRDNYTFQQDSVLGYIYQTLVFSSLNVAQKDKRVSILNIEVKSGNELFSKYFVEALAKEVSDFYVETKSAKAKLNVAILEKQTDSIRSELYSAISGVASANDNTYNLNPALNIKRVSSTKRQVDVQANTAILTQLVANLELARVALRKETPLIQIIDKPILPLKIEKIGKKKSLIVGFFIGFLGSVIFVIGQRLWKEIIIIK